MKKVALILLSLTLFACGQKEQAATEPKAVSVETVSADTANTVTSIEVVSLNDVINNGQPIIIDGAFNVTPDQFKERFMSMLKLWGCSRLANMLGYENEDNKL